MTDRFCVRGCTVPGVHYATCPQYGTVDPVPGGCRGCAPRPARDGAMVCDRDYRRTRRLLDDAPDLVGLIRSRADASKARAYDQPRVAGTRTMWPAPVAADITDAGDGIMRILHDWAGRAAGADASLPAGVLADAAYEQAHDAASVILEHFDAIMNSADAAGLVDAVTTRHSGDPAWWSIADAAARWPLADRPRRARIPCPRCDLKRITVYPPRTVGGLTVYRCQTPDCGWTADDKQDHGLWGDIYTGQAEVMA